MPSVVNKSERLITIGGYWLTPLIPMDVPDTVMNNDRIKELLESGELEIEGKKETTAKHVVEQEETKSEPKITKSSLKKPQPED